MPGFDPGGDYSGVSVFSAVRNHFAPAHSQRFGLETHLHLTAMAEWKSITTVV